MNTLLDIQPEHQMDAQEIGLQGSADALRPARVCMPTWRRFAQKAYHCGWYEAEDVISRLDDIDLIHLEPGGQFHRTELWHRRLVWRDVSRKLAYVNPGLRTVRLAKEYDLLFVHCQTWWELFYLNALDGWKDRCKTSVCWIDEMWATDLQHYKYWIKSLKRFDHVIVGFAGTVKALSEAIERQCYSVPVAVDVLRFTPYPKPPVRVVDVYSLGRRQEQIHQSLLKVADKDGMFYLYDTIQSGGSLAPDYRQHRDLLANVAKRSRYFVVAPAKINVPAETNGQVEVGLRYYEAAAAGAILLGQAPDCEPFRRMFDWPDSVIELKPDGSDVREVLESLAEQPERLREISKRNAAEALLRHDWAYRWSEILDIAGLKAVPDLQARKRRLRELADVALQPGGHC